jgi:membrane protease YdiL (CAAX protease family)
MTNGVPNRGEEVLEGPVEGHGLPPSDDSFAAALRGFGPVGVLAILVIVFAGSLVALLGPILILVWVWRSHTPWREIGYTQPKSWIGSLIIGIVFGSAFKLLMKVIVMPLLGAEPINQAYHYLAGNRATIPGFLFAVIVGAGFGEETFFRGYAFERLGKLLGHSVSSRITIVLLTSIFFGLAHYNVQGLAGTEQATLVGLVFGAIYSATGRIWMLMFAHAAFDLTAYAIIYWDLESDVAHLVFK